MRGGWGYFLLWALRRLLLEGTPFYEDCDSEPDDFAMDDLCY